MSRNNVTKLPARIEVITQSQILLDYMYDFLALISTHSWALSDALKDFSIQALTPNVGKNAEITIRQITDLLRRSINAFEELLDGFKVTYSNYYQPDDGFQPAETPQFDKRPYV